MNKKFKKKGGKNNLQNKIRIINWDTVTELKNTPL